MVNGKWDTYRTLDTHDGDDGGRLLPFHPSSRERSSWHEEGETGEDV